jgi:hypothetical protein
VTSLEPILEAARHRRTVADRSVRVVPGAAGRVTVVVLLPVADAQAIFASCDDAARLAR